MEIVGAWLLDNLGTVIGGLWSLLLPLVAHWVRLEVRPYLQAERRRKTAQWIAHLADELTDELKARHPRSMWTDSLDDAVDQLITAAGIKPEIARRAITASAGRKAANDPTSGAS